MRAAGNVKRPGNADFDWGGFVELRSEDRKITKKYSNSWVNRVVGWRAGKLRRHGLTRRRGRLAPKRGAGRGHRQAARIHKTPGLAFRQVVRPGIGASRSY